MNLDDLLKSPEIGVKLFFDRPMTPKEAEIGLEAAMLSMVVCLRDIGMCSEDMVIVCDAIRRMLPSKSHDVFKAELTNAVNCIVLHHQLHHPKKENPDEPHDSPSQTGTDRKPETIN